jgi:phage tail sheath gpL-like
MALTITVAAGAKSKTITIQDATAAAIAENLGADPNAAPLDKAKTIYRFVANQLAQQIRHKRRAELLGTHVDTIETAADAEVTSDNWDD